MSSFLIISQAEKCDKDWKDIKKKKLYISLIYLNIYINVLTY